MRANTTTGGPMAQWQRWLRTVVPILAVGVGLTGFGLSGSWLTEVSAQETKPSGRSERSKDARPAKVLPAFTAPREAAALAFVAQNHPELRRLLKTLSESDPKAYHSAIRELFAESERLADIQSRDTEIYAVALEQWKLDSRIHLMVARMQKGGSPDPEQAKRLRNLLRKSAELDIERRRAELKRMEQLIERRRSDIDERAKSMDSRIESRMQALLSRGRPARRDGAAVEPVAPKESKKASKPKETE